MDIGSKVGKLSWGDALWIAGAKILEEKFTAGIIGNGTFKSALMKGAAAVGVDMVFGDNKMASYLKTALVVDAAEDAMLGILGGTLGAGAQTMAADPVLVV